MEFIESCLIKNSDSSLIPERSESKSARFEDTLNLNSNNGDSISNNLKNDSTDIQEANNSDKFSPFSDNISLSDDDWSDSSEEMSNFFVATRPGYKQVAGKVKRVTRLDFEDYYRRRHLESFAKSMDLWNEFEGKFENKHTTPQEFTFTRLNFDRYRHILLNIDLKNLTPLDRFLFDLIESYYENMQNEDLNFVMSKLRRKYKIAPSKREIFERLESLECMALDQLDKYYNNNTKTSCNTNCNNKYNNDGYYINGNKTNNQKVSIESGFKHLLRNKAVRSNSGVVVITVLTSPGSFSCSEDCYYCPNEPGQPRSYLSTEPAVLRANQNDFDPVKQFHDRANTLYKNGHVIDKIEIIVLGGTWSGYPRNYQEEFIRDLFYAANIYGEDSNSNNSDGRNNISSNNDNTDGTIKRNDNSNNNNSNNTYNNRRDKGTLEYEHKINEKSKCRIIGLTLETRPDRINPNEIELLRKFGCTRVQLGIQHTDNEILENVNRGHTIEDSINAIYLLKENCFKVDIHIMPDLPGSNPDKDLEMFKYILSSPDLQVDQWKIYPCEVTPFTEIEKWHKLGKYVPYFDIDSNLLMNLLMKVKRSVHPWIRLNRVIRDIPNPSIIAGTNITNMRQLILDKLKKLGLKCSCIRCREIMNTSIGIPILVVRKYKTKGGIEYFISYENKNKTLIYGFLRLRLSNRKKYDEKISKFKCLTNAGYIRELHVYGVVVAHGEILDADQPSQHRGIGSSLILIAEIIASYNGYWNMAIIAGIGTREYYKKHGYKVEETFMTKKLSSVDMIERFKSSQLKHIKVPEVIEIEEIDLNEAARLVSEPLPKSKFDLIDKGKKVYNNTRNDKNNKNKVEKEIEKDKESKVKDVKKNKTYENKVKNDNKNKDERQNRETENEKELKQDNNMVINVNKYLKLAKYNNDVEIDYSKISKIDEIILNIKEVKESVKEFIINHPLLFTSLSFCTLSLFLSRLRPGRK